MNRFHVFGISQESWTKKYGVQPFEHPCSQCGTILKTTIPFFEGQLRGLEAPACKCGNSNTPYALVRDPKFGDLFNI